MSDLDKEQKEKIINYIQNRLCLEMEFKKVLKKTSKEVDLVMEEIDNCFSKLEKIAKDNLMVINFNYSKLDIAQAFIPDGFREKYRKINSTLENDLFENFFNDINELDEFKKNNPTLFELIDEEYHPRDDLYIPYSNLTDCWYRSEC
jgi:hypothetical protein